MMYLSSCAAAHSVWALIRKPTTAITTYDDLRRTTAVGVVVHAKLRRLRERLRQRPRVREPVE